MGDLDQKIIKNVPFVAATAFSLKIDLDTLRRPFSVYIESSGAAAFTVEGSPNDVDWRTLDSFSIAGVATIKELKKYATTTYRHIRVVGTAVSVRTGFIEFAA